VISAFDYKDILVLSRMWYLCAERWQWAGYPYWL